MAPRETRDAASARPHASDYDETAPLLGEEPSNRSPFTQPISGVNIAFYIAYFVALELGITFPANAFHQTVEENLCRDMHGRSDSDFCGAADDVQSELAVVMGWHSFARLAPGLICAIPYALLADRYGQRPFIALNALGMAMAAAFERIICFWPDIFPIRMVWTAPLLFIIGGGFTSSQSLLFANLSGLTTDASRASIMSIIVALSYGPRLVATLVSAKVLELYGPWPVLWSSLIFAFSCVLIPYFLVEPNSSAKVVDDSVAHESNANATEEENAAPVKGQLRDKIRKSLKEIEEGFHYVVRRCNGQIIRMAICLVSMTLAWQANFGSEIMRRKFGWTWAQISYLSVMNLVLTLMTSTFLLPGASYFMTMKLKLPTVTRDLTIVRFCALMMLIGGGFIIFSPTGAVLFIGAGIWDLSGFYNMVLKNLLVMAAGENSVMLFSCVNTVESIGNLLMAPLVAQLFKFGLHAGGVWMSLPVMVGCGFAAVALLLLGVTSDL